MHSELDDAADGLPRPPAAVDTPDLPPPPGLCSSTVDLGGDEYLVLSFPVPAWSLPGDLSTAERDIALAILKGASNETIAQERDTSVRTVANQIAAIFAKLDVSSRIELAWTVGTSSCEGDEG